MARGDVEQADVYAAIAEYDELGQDSFLEKYKMGPVALDGADAQVGKFESCRGHGSLGRSDCIFGHDSEPVAESKTREPCFPAFARRKIASIHMSASARIVEPQPVQPADTIVKGRVAAGKLS
jgi:hypothetical protein